MNTGMKAPRTYSNIVIDRHRASRERRDPRTHHVTPLFAVREGLSRMGNQVIVGENDVPCLERRLCSADGRRVDGRVTVWSLGRFHVASTPCSCVGVGTAQRYGSLSRRVCKVSGIVPDKLQRNDSAT